MCYLTVYIRKINGDMRDLDQYSLMELLALWCLATFSFSITQMPSGGCVHDYKPAVTQHRVTASKPPERLPSLVPPGRTRARSQRQSYVLVGE